MKKNKVLLIVVNVDWIFISHRLPIALEAKKSGYTVVVAAKDSGRADEIRKLGIEFYNLPISRSGKNPLKELKTIFALWKLYTEVKPNIVHHITMKPVLYGSIVLRFFKIGVLNAISGLGYSFTGSKKTWFQYLMIFLMKLGFNNKRVFLLFQNKDDFKELQSLNVISSFNQIFYIKGVGVDLNEYKSKETQIKEKNKTIVLFPARMLFDKGVVEFIKAAHMLKETYTSKVLFVLCGMIDVGNPSCISRKELQDYLIEGYLEWKGHQEEMISIYQNSDIVVLPSYREGLPKSLIEACAMGKPIITTDAIGCKECVDEGLNGYKVPVKSVLELAQAIEKLIINPELRGKMGKYSRQKAENEFSREEVIQNHLILYQKLCHMSSFL